MLPDMRGIVIASVTVVLTALVGCGGQGGSAASSTSSTSEQADAATIGQEVRDGNFAFTVTKVDPPRKSIGEQTAQGNYAAVYLTATNTDTKPQQFWGFNQMLKDAAGRKYKYDIEATEALDLEQDGNVDFNKSWLKPRSSNEYAVVFDLPVCVQPAEIELHDSRDSGGVTVKL
jgi:hypothetical protein